MKKQVRQKPQKNEDLRRPPVIVVLGHIDHGKTSLLDYIRKTRVAAKEAGGITQSIGAYQVEVEPSGKSVDKSRLLTFVDTPGHAAFAKMRARGAQVADVAVLVVAANDGVMPQTKEAIAHVAAAKIPIVVALNKVDLADANPTRAKGQLVKEGLQLEGQGGDTPVVEVSAKTGRGVPELLEMICLVADMLELRASPEAPLEAIVIESALSPRQGATATLVVRNGTLSIGDAISAGPITGKVKALIAEQGHRLEKVLPGMPAVVLGFSEVPPVGAVTSSTPTRMRKSARKSGQQADQQQADPTADSRDLSIVLRADTQGSLEAIVGVLSQLAVEKRRVKILYAGVGQVADSDIYLAQSAGGIVLGFNVSGSASIKKLADDLGVGLKSFAIIYELIETVEKILQGVSALEKAKIKGEGEVVRTFALHSKDIVLGVRVEAGKLRYRDKVKIVRGDEEVVHGQIRGLKIKESEVAVAEEGSEVGVLIKPQGDFRKGDKIIVL